MGYDLCDLDLWPMTLTFVWTSLLSLVITPENFVMIRWEEYSEKGVTDRQTDRRTERGVVRATWYIGNVIYVKLIHIIAGICWFQLCQCNTFHSSPPSAAYMRQWTVSTLVQVIACRLFSAKPLPEPNAGLLSVGLLVTNFSEIRIGILSFSFKKMHSKLSSVKTAVILSRGRRVNSSGYFKKYISCHVSLNAYEC